VVAAPGGVHPQPAAASAPQQTATADGAEEAEGLRWLSALAKQRRDLMCPPPPPPPTVTWLRDPAALLPSARRRAATRLRDDAATRLCDPAVQQCSCTTTRLSGDLAAPRLGSAATRLRELAARRPGRAATRQRSYPGLTPCSCPPSLLSVIGLRTFFRTCHCVDSCARRPPSIAARPTTAPDGWRRGREPMASPFALVAAQDP
jgi:hypothetical protein